jgi:hypothetical protein
MHEDLLEGSLSGGGGGLLGLDCLLSLLVDLTKTVGT